MKAKLGRAALVAMAVVAAGLLGRLTARAGGTAGGSSTRILNYAGNVTLPAGTKTFTFAFYRGTTAAGAAVCTVTSPGVAIDGAGNFTAPVDLDSATAPSCPINIFDGGDLTVRVSVSGVSGAVFDQIISPVPYAKYADKVAYGAVNLKLSDTCASCAASEKTPTGKISYTDSGTGGTFTGYRAAKKICERTFGTATAHMCAPAEMVALVSAGTPMPTTLSYVWMATGMSSGGDYNRDCEAFTRETTPATTTPWHLPSGTPHDGISCAGAFPIACCD
jgi:hypothetical protein